MQSIIVKITLLTLFLASTVLTRSYAQSDISRVSVSTSVLKKHVYLLALDSLQGRKTGTIGQLQAAFYCIRDFRQSHLIAAFRLDSIHASFRQTYPFTTTRASPFGSTGTYRTLIPPYENYALAAPPLTAKDSNRVSFGDNIAGLLVGTDLKQDIIVLSAHYDHLGKADGRLYHGADDNASGTATVLSVASVFDSLARQGVRPRRSILFVLFSGEEGGLTGSKYFVQNCPIPINQLMCDLNVDMIGRVDDAHRKKPDYCYLIKGRQGYALQKAAEAANRQSVNLSLNQGGYDTQNDPQQYFYRSDQVSFVDVGVPALFFTSGQHPDYHLPSDTADKLVYDVLQKRATLVFQTAWMIANLGQ